MYQKVDILGWNDRKFKRKQTQTKAIEKQGGGRVAGVESSVELTDNAMDWLPLSPSPTRLMIVHETP